MFSVRDVPPHALTHRAATRYSAAFSTTAGSHPSTPAQPCQCIPSSRISWAITHLPDSADEPISPPQTTLVKLLDAYLQSAANVNTPQTYSTCAALSVALLALSAEAQRSISRALGQGNAALPHATPEGLQEVDLALPGICEALVLVTQCLTNISLAAEDAPAGGVDPRRLLEDARAADGTPLVESIISKSFRRSSCFANKSHGTVLLSALDLFLPKLQFGRPVGVPSAPAGPVYASHRGEIGFSYLKRDLVRLLGVLCYERRGVQDRVRACGGIPVIMNLCVVDERNPCQSILPLPFRLD